MTNQKEQKAQQAQTIDKRPKMRSEYSETPKSRAVFYSILWPSMRKAARDLGWALALHGSLENDMDIMGMPWTEDCKSHQELAKAISDCLGDTIWREHHLTPHYAKPHGRIVYTMSIGGSWHVDLSIMPPPQEIVDSQAQKIAEQVETIARYENSIANLSEGVLKQAKEIERLKNGGLVKSGSSAMLIRNLRKGKG